MELLRLPPSQAPSQSLTSKPWSRPSTKRDDDRARPLDDFFTLSGRFSVAGFGTVHPVTPERCRAFAATIDLLFGWGLHPPSDHVDAHARMPRAVDGMQVKATTTHLNLALIGKTFSLSNSSCSRNTAVLLCFECLCLVDYKLCTE